jgi:3-deoxy-7-phosphoheptulonate synthase
MLVVMHSHATDEQVRAVCKRIESLGLKAHPIPGAARTAIGITGNDGAIDLGVLESMTGVAECIPVSKPYKLVSRDAKQEDSIIRIPTPLGDVLVGGKHLALVAGPCAVESELQCMTVAAQLKPTGVRLFRGGAYKPRTSPYSFQGLGEPGLQILAKVREEIGFGIITEAIDHESLDLVEKYADVIQIGARNMQNFSLLKTLGKCGRPILLKRGMSSTVKELLMSAEYVVAHGNPNVILCERGIRTFETATRNTFDISGQNNGYAPTFYPATADVAAAQRVTLGAAQTTSGIDITLTPTLKSGTPRPLFKISDLLAGTGDISPDGQRFVIAMPVK